jgi:hypothetical protein
MSPSGRLWLALFLVISRALTHPVPMASSVGGSATLVVHLLSSLPANEQTALLEACSLAHAPARCIDASQADESETLRAVVDFEGETRVTLDVTDTDPAHLLYAFRELTFEPSDDREERARAIGLALGVLATAQDRESPPNKPEPPPPEETREPPPRAQEPQKKRATEEPLLQPKTAAPARGPWGVALSGGARVVPSWGVGAPTGVLGLLGYPVPNWGGLFSAQLASFPPGSRNISMTHISATLGPTFRTVTSPFFLSGALTAGVQSTAARLNSAEAEVRKGSHLSPLLHAEGTLGRDVAQGVAVTFSPSFDVLFSDTEISVNGRQMGRTGTYQASFLLGLLLMPVDTRLTSSGVSGGGAAPAQK